MVVQDIFKYNECMVFSGSVSHYYALFLHVFFLAGGDCKYVPSRELNPFGIIQCRR